MIKILSFIRRNPALTPKEFRDYWTNVHAPLVLERLPGLIHYKGNFPIPRTHVPVAIDATQCDLVVEMAFADRATMDAQMTSPEFLAADREASSNHFMDMAASSALVVEEVDALWSAAGETTGEIAAMARSINCRRASHSNIVIENLDASVKHLEEVFGGRFVLDLPGNDWHACLVEVGGFITELFEPKNFMLHGRIGPHYLGMEYEANLEEARAVVAEHGIRIIRDIVQAIHTDPRDGLGVDYEFFDGTFYGPETKVLKILTESEEYWAAHPIGYTGLVGYTHAVADLEAASRFLQSFLGAKPVYEVEREALGARAIGLQVANDVCEIVSPTGNGQLLREMMRTGEGIRSTVYSVKSVAAARAWFAGKGLRVIDGTAPGSIAVDPRDNLGILFEFVEGS